MPSVDLANATSVAPEEAPVSRGSELNAPVAVDLSAAQKVVPAPAPVVKLAPLSEAGVDLAKWLLVIISIFVLISVVWIWSAEWGYSTWLGLDQLKQAATAGSVAETVLKDRESFREFWLKIFQMVLLNVLLPVLTAILGYTFGSSKNSGQ